MVLGLLLICAGDDKLDVYETCFDAPENCREGLECQRVRIHPVNGGNPTVNMACMWDATGEGGE